MTITIHYLAVDGARATRRFRTIKEAQAYAHDRVGKHPEIGSYYAVSGGWRGPDHRGGLHPVRIIPAAP
jgi:hypothetical protein